MHIICTYVLCHIQIEGMEERTVSNARRIEDLTMELRKLTDRNASKNKEIKKMQDLVSTRVSERYTTCMCTVFVWISKCVCASD